MKTVISKYIEKLFFKRWILGICYGNIQDIIRNKKFDYEINWLKIKSFDKFYADPFAVGSESGSIKILFEDLTFAEGYGKISLMSLDKNLNQVSKKIILDTKSHLSYPYIFKEDNKIYVFPESSKSGKLSCYQYDPLTESVCFLQDIIDLPLLDATIVKYNKKYWIFGTLSQNGSYKLHVFFSDNLLGPYSPIANNPVKSGLDGTRSAGNFINVDGIIYRPSQNCKRVYGESITINKILELNELNVVEEPYFTIEINKKIGKTHNIHTLHTINALDNVITVDGEYWTFSPFQQLLKFTKKHKT